MTDCERLQEMLEDPNLDPRERLRLEQENLNHCQPDGDMQPNLSGGGGTKNPPPPHG